MNEMETKNILWNEIWMSSFALRSHSIEFTISKRRWFLSIQKNNRLLFIFFYLFYCIFEFRFLVGVTVFITSFTLNVFKLKRPKTKQWPNKLEIGGLVCVLTGCNTMWIERQWNKWFCHLQVSNIFFYTLLLNGLVCAFKTRTNI